MIRSRGSEEFLAIDPLSELTQILSAAAKGGALDRVVSKNSNGRKRLPYKALWSRVWVR